MTSLHNVFGISIIETTYSEVCMKCEEESWYGKVLCIEDLERKLEQFQIILTNSDNVKKIYWN